MTTTAWPIHTNGNLFFGKKKKGKLAYSLAYNSMVKFNGGNYTPVLWNGMAAITKNLNRETPIVNVKV